VSDLLLCTPVKKEEAPIGHCLRTTAVLFLASLLALTCQRWYQLRPPRQAASA